MAQYVTKIRTESGDLQIDYNALANKPVIVAPYNYLVNSDFTKFVAQVGVGEAHLDNGDYYAGDRWVLRDAELDGSNIGNIIKYNTSVVGDGYRNIYIKGTIYQVVTEKFESGNYTCGVETISGTAYARYDEETRRFSITSEQGCTLKYAWMYKGVYKNVPAYQPKGYTTELADCQKYFQVIRSGSGHTYYDEEANRDLIVIVVPTSIVCRPDPESNAAIIYKDEAYMVTNNKKFNFKNDSEFGVYGITLYTPRDTMKICLKSSYKGSSSHELAFLHGFKIYIDMSPEYILYFG